MDSHQWIKQQASGAMDNSDQHDNCKDDLDLTLKLGLPNGDGDQNQEQWIDFIPTMASHGQANLSGHDYQIYTKGMNAYYEMGNVGGQTIHNNANNLLYVWQPPRMGCNAQYNMQPNYMHAFASQFSGSLPGLPVFGNFYHSHNNSMMRTNHHMILPPPPSQAMKDYTLLDHVPMKRSSMKAQRTYSVSNIRCTNYNCNTNYTPMWRKGPLGPKTLCNACGIKYRKDEDKRKAIEAESGSSSSHDQESNN